MGQKIHPLGFRIGITQKHRGQWFAKPKQYSNYIQEDQLIRDFLSEQLSGSGMAKQVKNSPRETGGQLDGKNTKSKISLAGDAGLSKTLLSRRADRLLVEVHVAQPKIVTGEGGNRLKELTSGIQKIQKLQAIYRSQLDYRSSLSGTTDQSNSTGSGGEARPNDAQSEMNQHKITGEISTVSLHVVQVEQPATDATLLAQKVAQQLEKRVAFRRIMKQSIQQAREAGVEGIKIQISGRLNGAEIARREWAREGRVPLHTLRANIDYCAYPAQTIYGLLGIKIWIYKNS
jgi:small subunit ribosomal protein S3